MLRTALGVLLLFACVPLAVGAVFAAGPQPVLDAADAGMNNRVFELFAGGAAVLFLGGLLVLLHRR